MSYWDDLNEYDEKVHKRVIAYENVRHAHRIKELEYEVILFAKYEKDEL